MYPSSSLIHCVNPTCPQPLNPVSNGVCESCQTPLVHRYLWAVDSAVADIAIGEQVAERYEIVAPQIWLDTRPDRISDVPETLPNDILPYLRLYPQRLHIPEVYGYAVVGEKANLTEVLLLDNVPISQSGSLMPSIIEAWHQASPVRQVYWLWQILQLWNPLSTMGVVSSLLVAENLRVEGWRVRLTQLYPDFQEEGKPEFSNIDQNNGFRQAETQTAIASPVLVKPSSQPTLQRLGACFSSWFIAETPLQDIFQQLQAPEVSFSAIARQLNQLLLDRAAQQTLEVQVASKTDRGPAHKHNEDKLYPNLADLSRQATVASHLSIVCDGIGGHEGGEIASQLGVQSLQLQVQALLTEVAAENEILMPDLVREQIATAIRVTNNLIASQNDAQGRESRKRMGTTVVMALQLPQQIQTAVGVGNSHELYLAHVGDSRAYWITRNYCQQLTVDDDVAGREVRMGRNLYKQASDRSDAGALTQALGTRDAQLLRPTVQRFIIEEDGLLLLCSDGLSDNDWIEQAWVDYAEPILSGKISLEMAVDSLIDLANEKNGHDNISVVLRHYRVSSQSSTALDVEPVIESSLTPDETPASEVLEAAPPALSEELKTPDRDRAAPRKSPLKIALGVLTFIVLVTGIGLTAWLGTNPQALPQLRNLLLRREQPQPAPETGDSTIDN